MVEWKIFRQDAVNILGEDKVSRGEQIYKGQFKEGRIDINKLFKILNKEGLLKPKQKKQIQTAFQQRSQEERNVTIANTPAKRNVPLTRINGTDETKTLHQPGKVPKTIETDEEEIDISAHLDGFDDEKATYIGKYKIIKELGRGGMGAVYLCEDPTFETVQREVAVKKLILPAKKAKNKQAQAELTTRTERAKREAGLTAILARHDNIIKIYDSGIDPTDNNFFYSMEVVNGKEWNDVLRTVAEIRRTNKPLPERYSLENMLETLLKVCDAMAYAHDQEIIHRDLKPENVMVDEKFGSVKVMDWGLAKKIDEADTLRLTQSKKTLEEYMKNMDVGRTITALTIDGQIMGTPKFMGPEQATNAKRLDQTADVYSLGAMLYNVLTGKPPIVTKGSIWNLIKKIKAGDITPPIKSKNPLYQIPPEINAITMKALAKDKRNRYQTAKELAKDIRAFLTNKEVSSYPYTFSEKAARFVQKHATATIATLLLTLGLGISGVAYQSFRAADARADAETARAEKADLEKKIEKQKRKKAEKRAVKAEDAYEGQSEAINKLQSLEQLTQNEDYYDAALQIINEAVHESKNFWQPYLARAKHYATFGHYTEAEEDFEKAQILYKKQHQKESVEIWFEAGMQYGLPAGLGGQGESDKALQYFEKAVQIGPKTVWGKLSRAVSQIIHAKKNPEDAWELIPDALEATSNLNQDTVAKNITATQLVYAWIKGASVISKYKYPVFFEYADLPEAKKTLEKLIRENKGNIHIKNFLALIYKKTGNCDKAIELLSDILSIQEHSFFYTNRGSTYSELGNLEKALLDFNKALQLNFDDADVYVEIGIAHLHQNDFDTAIKNFRKAIRMSPKSAIAHYNLGLAFYQKKDLENALTQFNEAIHINKYYSGAYSGLGMIFADQEQHERAIELYTKAIQCNSKDPFFYTNRGNSFTAEGNLEEAIQDYDTAIKLDSEYANAYYSRARAHTKNNAFEKAIQDYTETIKRDKKHLFAHINRGVLYQNAGAKENARADYRTALEINSQAWQASLQWGILDAQDQKYAESLSHLRHAHTHAPEQTKSQISQYIQQVEQKIKEKK